METASFSAHDISSLLSVRDYAGARLRGAASVLVSRPGRGSAEKRFSLMDRETGRLSPAELGRLGFGPSVRARIIDLPGLDEGVARPRITLIELGDARNPIRAKVPEADTHLAPG